MKTLALTALLAGSAAAVHAAEPIGVLEKVSGTVSVGGQGFVVRATEGTPIANGSSILVASNGRAVLALRSGCSIALAPSQHLTVNAKLPCEQLQASVKQLFTAYRVAQATTGPVTTVTPPPATEPLPAPGGSGLLPGLPGGLVTVAGVVGGVTLTYQLTNKDSPPSPPVSPQ